MSTPEHTPAAYAQDVEATRARVLATIDDLQARLAPRALVGNAVEGAMSALIGSGGTMLLLARRLMRDHPVVTAAAGVAIGLSLVGRRKLSKVKVDLGEEPESYSDFDDGYAANITAFESHNDTSVSAMVAENPLAAVFAGLAAGALFGALFPGTRSENQLIGAYRDRILAAARAATHRSDDDGASTRAAA
jgi:hypothetical protein